MEVDLRLCEEVVKRVLFLGNNFYFLHLLVLCINSMVFALFLFFFFFRSIFLGDARWVCGKKMKYLLLDTKLSFVWEYRHLILIYSFLYTLMLLHIVSFLILT